MHRRVREHVGRGALAIAVVVTAGACTNASTVGNAGGSLDLAGTNEIEGVVHDVHAKSGWFTMDAGGHIVTVSMPNGAPSHETDRFKALRTGDQVDLYGVSVGDSHLELRHFHLID